MEFGIRMVFDSSVTTAAVTEKQSEYRKSVITVLYMLGKSRTASASKYESRSESNASYLFPWKLQ